jgi:hypothetical protein
MTECLTVTLVAQLPWAASGAIRLADILSNRTQLAAAHLLRRSLITGLSRSD